VKPFPPIKLKPAHGAFGPRSFHIARFLIRSRAPSLPALLDEVADAFPNLSFTDFYGGYVLSDILVRFPGQIRTVAEGLPPPTGDPVEWLEGFARSAPRCASWPRSCRPT
jgi:hypothetical protein